MDQKDRHADSWTDRFGTREGGDIMMHVNNTRDTRVESFVRLVVPRMAYSSIRLKGSAMDVWR